VPRPKPAAKAAPEFPANPAVTLVCPKCRASLVRQPGGFLCRDRDCRRVYPIKDGIPLFLVSDAVVLELDEWLSVAGG